MSHDTHSQILGKLTLAVCLKAAKFGMPKQLDPRRVMRWIQHPEALEKRMHGLLDFLVNDPDFETNQEPQVETATLSPIRFRTTTHFLSELKKSDIVSDQPYDKKAFAGITADNAENLRIRLISAVCFNRQTTASDADNFLVSIGSKSASIDILALAGMQMPGFIRHLGLVAACGTRFGTNGSAVIPFLYEQKNQPSLRLDYGHFNLPWPAGTWFLGISGLSSRVN